MTYLKDFCDCEIVQVDPLSPNAPFHLSLSRTLYIKHHQKDLFRQKIIDALKCTELPTQLKCENIEIYLNDEVTRTFVAIDVENDDRILKSIGLVDKILEDFGLPVYYKSPKLHYILYSCQVNQKDKFKEFMSLDLLKEYQVNIEGILMKFGNKVTRIR